MGSALQGCGLQETNYKLTLRIMICTTASRLRLGWNSSGLEVIAKLHPQDFIHIVWTIHLGVTMTIWVYYSGLGHIFDCICNETEEDLTGLLGGLNSFHVCMMTITSWLFGAIDHTELISNIFSEHREVWCWSISTISKLMSLQPVMF